MGLLELHTDLKSLKYGSDRPGGGNSNEPYIKTDINKVDDGFNRLRLTRFDDGFIRGGVIGTANSAIVDTLRIGKFLIDFPKGPLFLVKQVGLQLSNPRLEIPRNPINIFQGGVDNLLSKSTNGLLEPTRIYNLGINTLAQIPVNAIGGHINRHGLLPVQSDASKYESVVKANNNDVFLSKTSTNNRLVKLTEKFKLGDRIGNKTQDKNSLIPQNIATTVQNILRSVVKLPNIPLLNTDSKQLVIDDYIAGPGSTYGIGNTLIKRYSYTEDTSLIQGALDNSKAYAGKTRDSKGQPQEIASDLDRLLGASHHVVSILAPKDSNKNPISGNKNNIPVNLNNRYATTDINGDKNGIYKTYPSHSIIPNTSNQFRIYNSALKEYSSTPTKISYKNTYGETYSITGSTNWSIVSRENRVGSGRIDKLNSLGIIQNRGIYEGNDTFVQDGDIRDLVKFRIQAVNTDGPDMSNWMVFRAYLTQFADNVDASWNPIKYAGRGDKLYTYDGFTRKISIGFKAAALSAGEMKPMYQRLNYLMSNLMPDYTGDLLMRGPLVRMTVGNYIDSQLGILESLSYTVPQESPWEIALDEPEGGTKQLILPHVIEVTLNFTPIGTESKGNNYNSQKAQNFSNLAQNNTGPDVKTLQYIT